jgi:hypothetical protein
MTVRGEIGEILLQVVVRFEIVTAPATSSRASSTPPDPK